MASQNTIKVVARFRPPNKTELANSAETVVSFKSDDTCNVQSKDANGAFTFDRVFDMDSRQQEVFEYSIRPTVDDILNGYNGTVFAYGQTGAGKSYTMMGADIDDEITKGLIPRITEQIFANIAASPSNIEYTVRVSYMEIYMERIKDLLVPQNDNLPVHEEKSRGVYVKGLLEVYVSSVAEVYEVMRRGGLARAVAATNMNQESSRSHSIFVITVAQKNVETGSAKSGQLFLVDLAGSEKVGKTGASGQVLEEAKKINKSLSALGLVINSLTDGKSTHVPYRDSKLTRILQESLGGNSRTSLIINCSPSSYNAGETLSTLRFGERAKKIQNKAKINAELSPAELKALLKKAQTQVTSFEDYISNLESEINVWRTGESVPKDKWIPMTPSTSSTRKTEVRSLATPGTPSRPPVADARRIETPSRPDSRFELDRSTTPSAILEKDEREEFLRRENELQDLLSEKENSIAKAEHELRQAKEELQAVKLQQKQINNENERLQSEGNEFRMQIERVQFENKETMITMDGLKDANAELTSELDDVKQQLLDAKISVSETNAALDEKEKKKAERMAQMMASFDLGGAPFSENEHNIRKIIESVETMLDATSEGGSIAPNDLHEIREKLIAAQGVVRQAELSLTERDGHDDAISKQRDELEDRIVVLGRELEELLERNLAPEDVEEVKSRLGAAYQDRHGLHSEMVERLKTELAQTSEDNRKLKQGIDTLEQQAKNGTATNGVAANGLVHGKTIQQQIADFDVMKKSLMRDLQNRCERVVELEISLDETREQYNNVLRTSNNRAQQKKMAFLERNLEQLTHVQRQLMEQNSTLKKEVAIAERKLIARNDRIQSLEALLQDSQEKLTAANHRFEAQLNSVKERLEAAKVSRALGGAEANQGFALGGAGSRIAKPLRGGGGEVNGAGNVLHAQDGNGGNKRSSWFSGYQRAWPAGGSWSQGSS